VSKTLYGRLALGLVMGLAPVCGGAETPAKFLGANSCASASCHGGGGAHQDQFLVWSLKDFHSQRPPATLATARSKQIADALAIKDPAADARCTVCHAPLNSVPENLRGENFKAGEGVSCESCHGAAENWIRSHTRKDYTRADRTASGMRDLQNLYVRANTCVACHQNVDADILKAGHPELIFELDGQSVAEPKHWSAEKSGNGAQAWLVGQAVALREMSWQLYLAGPGSNSPEIVKSPAADRYYGLAPLIWKVSEVLGIPTPKPVKNNGVAFKNAQAWSDQIAKTAAGLDWSDAITRKFLYVLAGSSKDFRDDSVSQNLQARRAERLVLALDRLVTALPEYKNNESVQASLNQLFKLAQSVPDFDPKPFAAALEKFSTALAAP